MVIFFFFFFILCTVPNRVNYKFEAINLFIFVDIFLCAFSNGRKRRVVWIFIWVKHLADVGFKSWWCRKFFLLIVETGKPKKYEKLGERISKNDCFIFLKFNYFCMSGKIDGKKMFKKLNSIVLVFSMYLTVFPHWTILHCFIGRLPKFNFVEYT